ncbi:MAG: PorT family protein [Candidatus Aminicenantes bacterium]|nr:MAG: PorT family protein [Candidatus Aminicenantes bacterium]
MSKRFSKIVVVLMVLGLSGAFASLVLANQPGVKAGFQGIEGAKLGVFYDIDLGETLQFQPGIYYTLRKYRVPPPDWYDTPDEKIYDTVRFIEIPVLLKYRFNLRGPSQPFLFGGGYVAFRISEQMVFDNSFPGGFRQYAGVDGGVVLGAGFEHGRGRMKFHLDFRANIGLSRVQKVEHGMFLSSLSPPIKNKNRSLSILLGVSF